MKKCIVLFAVLLLIVACKQEPIQIPVTGITLSQTSVELTEGESTRISATVSPNNATNKAVIWSSNSSYVNVTDGTITGIKPCTAVVTAKTDDGGKVATCSVTVIAKIITVTGVTIDKTSLDMVEGDETTLVATVSPENATNKTVIWSSSDGSVASISDGKVTAKKPGSATITAKTEDGGKTATCAVKVKAKTIAVTGVAIDKTSLDMVEGDAATLVATVTPENATNKTVIWSSSDEAVASVSDGKVTAKKPGSAIITAKTEDGDFKAECAVVVNQRIIPVTGVTLDKNELSLTISETYALSATVLPDNASNKNVSWISTDESVATVSDGNVQALKTGTSIIRVITEDGEKSADCQITVKEPVKATSISLNGATWLSSAKVGRSYSISAVVKPDDAFVDLEWSVSDPSLAEITGDGKTIVLKSKDYGPSTLTVRDKITNLSVSEKMRAGLTDFYWTENTGKTRNGCPLLELEIGEEHQLQCHYTPEYATRVFRFDMDGFWYYEPLTVSGVQMEEPGILVSRPSFFSIDENGKVTGVKEGLTKLHVYSPIIINDAQDLYIHIVNQHIPVTGVSLNETNLEMVIGATKKLVASFIPSNATHRELFWTCSNESVVKLSNADLSNWKNITALQPGSATITVTTDEGGFMAQCQVTVKEDDGHVEGVSLNKTSIKLMPGEQMTLTATITPETATNKKTSWSSSDNNVATVKDGVVTAVSIGTAVITVTTEDGGKTATCQITVSNDITQFVSASYNGGSMSIINGTIQAGSKLNFSVKNGTQSKTILVKTVQLTDSSTGVSTNEMTINAQIAGEKSSGWTITLGTAMKTPVAKFVYYYDGVDYVTSAAYRSYN